MHPSRPATPKPAAEEEMISLKLSDAPLDLVLQQIADLTGRTILRPQQLPTPMITINISKPIPKSEALLALETLLNLNQIGLTPMGDNFLKVTSLPMVRTEAPQMIEGSALDLPPSGRIATKLFQLEFLRVNEFLPQINPLLNPNMGGPVIFEKTNAALITDSISTIQRIELLLKKLDQPLVANISPHFYTVHFAKASDLVTKLKSMLQGSLQSQLGTATSYSADDRTNQIILIADPRQYVLFDELIAKLDVKSDPNTRTDVIYLKHATAKDVATLVSQLISGQNKVTQTSTSVSPGQMVQPGQQGQPGQPTTQAQQAPINVASGVVAELGSTQFSSLVTVIPDDRSNAVVVNGTVDDLRLIKDLVEKIDVVLAQVRIEVVITEVTLSDSSSTGISALGLDVVGNKLIGFSGSISGGDGTSNSMSIANDANSSGYYAARGEPNSTTPYALSSGLAATAGHYSLVGLITLNATPRKGNSRIISEPVITTTHNKEAKFFFGETRPVITGSTSVPTGTSTNTGSSNLTTSSQVTQQEIGTNITVKPLIGNDGSVQLDIKQTISDVSGTVTIDGNTQYIIGKRETDSFVTVKSGEIIVLAGMQKENNTHNTSRLGPIPWIGDLLGARSRSKSRSELVIFIRPVVLTNTSADNEAALKQINNMEGKEEIKEKLDPKYVAPKKSFYQRYKQIP